MLKGTLAVVLIGFVLPAVPAQTDAPATNAADPGRQRDGMVEAGSSNRAFSSISVLGEIRTPKSADIAHINGPSVFGVRPGHPFLYHIPATGVRPMQFTVDSLPAGLKVDANSGQITGSLETAGEYRVILRAKNAKGADRKDFRIVVGETIALTPAMGWNSWNCWGGSVSQDKVLVSARAMVSSGLINHGFAYINIDDAWQAPRRGPLNALQGNGKFPDLKKLADEIHALGLKAGIYSTPWEVSYAGYPGGSAETPEGTFHRPTIRKIPNRKILPWAIGPYHFATNDAKQWAAWGMDYLKYDWNPNEGPETREMYGALRNSGRDFVFSLSNNSPFENARDLTPVANSWRTTGDIRDNWNTVSGIMNRQDRWRAFAKPGHRNDPDMLVVGSVGGWGGRAPKPSGLTPDEQYTHITVWCLFGAPLLIGCDMEHLDGFTFNLLSNDEVLAVDQDALGQQAECVSDDHGLRVYAKDLEDGSKAVGLVNLSTNQAVITAKWADLKLSGRQVVRDLWRQKNVGHFDREFHATVASHGAELFKISSGMAQSSLHQLTIPNNPIP
jgi:alpha-galactosidase